MKLRFVISTPILPPKYRIQPDSAAMCLYFLASLADGAFMPFFTLWAQHEANISVRFIGLLLACYAGGELIATPLLGGIADQLGRRPVLLCSTLGVGGGFLVLSHLHDVLAIALCLIGIGIFECALHPTISTVIADTVAADQLRMRYAAARMASSLGRVAGPALGAALALISLNAVFAGCSISLFCASMLIVSSLPETQVKGESQDSIPEGDDRRTLSARSPVFRDRRLVALLLWFAIVEIVGSWPEVITPPYARDADALSASGVGLLFSYSAAIVVILQWPVARWTAKIAISPLVVTAGIAVAAGFGLLLIHPNVITLYASATLLSLAQVLFGPLVPVTVNAFAPASARASYMAAVSIVSDLRDTAGPASGMYLYGLSPRLPWMLGMPIALLASFALAVTIKRSDRSRRSRS